MESLLNGMLSKLGEQGLEKISSSVGVNPDTAKKVVEQATSLLGAKMADNTTTEEGLQSLDTALEDHDGSIFDNLDDLVDSSVDTKGGKIIQKILGSKAQDFVNSLSSGNNLDSETTTKLVEMVAPLVLGQLGSQKKTSRIDLSSVLQNEKKQVTESSNSTLVNLATNFLDQDNDGSVVDDVIGLAGKFFGNK